jgi:hypothetical protein
MTRLADVALRLVRRRDHLRRHDRARPHKALDRRIREAVAFAAGQFARRHERRRRRGAVPGSKQKASDRVPQGVHAWDRSEHFQQNRNPIFRPKMRQR